MHERHICNLITIDIDFWCSELLISVKTRQRMNAEQTNSDENPLLNLRGNKTTTSQATGHYKQKPLEHQCFPVP